MARFGTSSAAIVATLCIIASTLAAPAPARAATTRNVPGTYATIQAAVDASAPGDTVLVAPGAYAEHVVIDKAITLQASGGADVTTIDGGANGNPVIDLTLEAGEAPVVRGFTITNGWYAYGGAGVHVFGGEPLIEHNRIVANHGGGGSGIYAQTSSPTIQDNVIADNTEQATSGGRGGGIGLVGAGTGSAVIRRNTISGNIATGGGGISLNGVGTVTIDRNVIRGNSGGTGGGIELFNSSWPVVTNNVIAENSAGQGGGSGGGIDWQSGSGAGAPSLVNNTIADNSATTGSAVNAGWDAAVVIRNNVFSGTGSTALVACLSSATPVFTNNDTFNPGGPEYAGCPAYTGSNGNVSVNPKLLDPAGHDYHLRPDSPLIDAGTNTGAPSTDLDGDARPHDGDENGTATVDIGADEAIDPLLVDPPAIDFGDRPLTLPAPTVNVTVRNYGGSPIDIDTLAVVGTGASAFSIGTDGCTNATLAAGQACTIGMLFQASALGERVANLQITGPGAVGTRSVRLSGTGIDPITVSPPSIDFGNEPAGGTDTPVTVTVTNAGAADLPITSVGVSGANSTDFPIQNQTCTAAPVNTSCAVTVGFTPTALGDRAATLSITGPDPVGVRTVELAGNGTTPSSGVTWGTVETAGPKWTWNSSNALARTVQSGTQRLHAVYATDRVGGEWASDKGPYVGAYYVRSTSGSTWSTPKRISPASKHAPWIGLAATGPNVYAVWVTYAKWIHYSPTAPRVLYVRANTNHGASTAWQPAIRLTATDGRVSYPVIAAAGDDVHVAWTDGDTGAIRVASSTDHGAHWASQTIGTTTLAFASGFAASPEVAVDGATVVVAWLSDETGSLVARVSTDRGLTWGDPEPVGGQANGSTSVAVLGSRIAVAWTTEDQVVIRQRIGGSWDTARVIADLGTDGASTPYAPVVELNGSGRVGVAWAHELDSRIKTNLRWIESADGGAVWFAPQTVAQRDSVSDRVRNDWASVVWASAGSRYVLWNGYNNDFSNYRLYLRKGSGAPVGIASAAPAWIPDADPAPARMVDPMALPGE